MSANNFYNKYAMIQVISLHVIFVFREAGYHTKDIQFAYDVSKLLKLYNE